MLARSVQVDLDVLADPHRRNLAKAKRREALLDRQSLRVVDQRLGGNDHARDHGRRPRREIRCTGGPDARRGRARERAHTFRGPAPWLRGGDEERIPAGVPMPEAWGQWAAWAPKIRRGPPAGIARSGFVPRLAREEGLAHEALVGGEVAQAGLRDDVLWKLWRVGLLIPARPHQPVAHELLVIRIGRGADLVCRRIPVARAVGGEYIGEA